MCRNTRCDTNNVAVLEREKEKKKVDGKAAKEAGHHL